VSKEGDAAYVLAYSPAAGVRPAALRSSVVARSNAQASIFESAQSSFEAEFPEFAKRGFGPTTKAERWNGRHAMFGWFAIVATGYAISHGVIPDFDTPLDLSVWGPLAKTGDASITNGRAIILIAHVHALFVSLASALAPFGFQDSLTLNMKAGEKDEEAYGVFIPFKGMAGLTPAAEMANGRLAMLGLVATVATSASTGTPFLNVVDQMLGGLLLK